MSESTVDRTTEGVTDLCEDCNERPITGLDARCDSCRENATIDVIERLHFAKSQQNGYGELADDCIAEITQLRELLGVARCPNKQCIDGVLPHLNADGNFEPEQCQWCNERKAMML